MEIKCPKCSEIFVPNKKEEIKISEAVKKGQTFFMTECTKCYKGISINPCDLLNETVPDEEKTFYCPICKDLTISYVKDESEEFYGCGECGNVWNNLDEIK